MVPQFIHTIPMLAHIFVFMTSVRKIFVTLGMFTMLLYCCHGLHQPCNYARTMQLPRLHHSCLALSPRKRLCPRWLFTGNNCEGRFNFDFLIKPFEYVVASWWYSPVSWITKLLAHLHVHKRMNRHSGLLILHYCILPQQQEIKIERGYHICHILPAHAPCSWIEDSWCIVGQMQ